MSDPATDERDDDTAVRASILVEAAPERAFEVFTTGIDTWWPPEHHILEAPLAEMVFEPHVGGHIIDRGVDGSECRWARVLAYEPPARFVISWDIDLDWQLEHDPTRTSEIEVVFVEERPGLTRVLLEHRHLDRHGDGWEAMGAAVGSPDGWPGGLNAFAARVGAHESAQRGFLFKLTPPRPDFPHTMSEAERVTMLDHVTYWRGLADAGHVLAFGPVDDPTGSYGIGIVLAETMAAAESLRDADPAIRSPHGFHTEIHPILQLVTPHDSYPNVGDQ